MSKNMNQNEISVVENRIKEFESKTGCELLLVVAAEADPYPGASWRFGLMGGFIVSLLFSHYYSFHESWMWPISYFIISLFMTRIGHFQWAKKWALSDWETERECKEKSIELFHSLGTSTVTHNVTAMIMISELEKKIQVLIDSKLAEKINKQDLDDLIGIMKTHFKSGQKSTGIVKSIELLETKILDSFGNKVTENGPDEISNKIHFISINS